MKKIGLLLLLFFCSKSYSQNPCPGIPTVDYGGKNYNTVQVGNQCWLKENLDIGTMILGVDTSKNNGILEKYCFDDYPPFCETYGGLYNWDEAMQYVITDGAKGICPTGWHIPTNSEFQTLATTVSNNGNALIEIGQGPADGGGTGTNTSGFSALFAGVGFGYTGIFQNLTYEADFWSSSESSSSNANEIGLIVGFSSIGFYSSGKQAEFSVRCINNNIVSVEDNNKPGLPKEFILLQNFPNPFNPTTTINYSIAKEDNVKLTVYNIIGSKVATIVNEYKPAGNYSLQFNGSNLASGIYLYRLESGNYIATKKFILMK